MRKGKGQYYRQKFNLLLWKSSTPTSLLSERFVLVDAALRVLYFLWACISKATKAAFGQKTTVS